MKKMTRMIHAPLAAITLGWLAVQFAPNGFGVVPPPDGGYPGFTTAEGTNALKNLTTGVANTAIRLVFALLRTAQAATTLAWVPERSFSTTETKTRHLARRRSYSTPSAPTTQPLAIGFSALLNNTGSGNVALGTLAGANLTTGNSNLVIGNLLGGVAGESNTMRIGLSQFRTFISGIRGVTTGNANAIPVLIDSDGQLGTMSSSRRFKHEIKPMDTASQAILSLKPVTFNYKSDNTNTPQFGLIAEEVAEVKPGPSGARRQRRHLYRALRRRERDVAQ